MKVSQEYLKQVIKEEVDMMIQEGELDEGALDFMKSLGGQAAGAVKGMAQKAGSAVAGKVGQAVGAVKGAAQKAGAAVGGAVDKAKTASLEADVNKQFQAIGQEISGTFKKFNGLMKRAQSLKAVNPQLVDKLYKVDQMLAQVAKEVGVNSFEESEE